MGIKVEATAKTEQGKAIKAIGNEREIEVELEMAHTAGKFPICPNG